MCSYFTIKLTTMINKDIIGNLSPDDSVDYDNDYVQKTFNTIEELKAYYSSFPSFNEEESGCGCCGYFVDYYITDKGAYESVEGYGASTNSKNDYTIRIAKVK